MNPLEKIARVLWQSYRRSLMGNLRDSPFGKDEWREYVPLAQHVMQLIRDPTEEMIQAGLPALIDGIGSVDEDELKAAYQAMIDFAADSDKE